MARRVIVAIDAMGGDRAPEAIVAGALRCVSEAGVDVCLYGDSEAIQALLPNGVAPLGVTVCATTQVIAMDADAAKSVRAQRDSSIVRAAEAVRDHSADAFVGAGNTGATMAAALLRFGRIQGVSRPAIAVPLPIPGSDRRQLLVDGGATVDPDPEWLVQWAQLGQAYARTRIVADALTADALTADALTADAPTVGLLSNGEEAGKGDQLRKAAFALLQAAIPAFVGNVEGRDLARGTADVVVTDGFTGNVALKTLEGAMMAMAGLVFGVLDEPEFASISLPIKLRLLEAAAPLFPDNTGGALLLGVEGVCIISHGSSSADAIVNAAKVARQCVENDVVNAQRAALRPSELSGASALQELADAG